MFNEYIDNKKDEIVSQVCRLIQIPSVYEDSTDPTKPFGENTNKALEYALSLGEQLGFRIKNVDGYCGYIEFGEGEELVGIIGHLDVVPVGSGWTHDPFLGTVQNGNIYGRGAIDDKGPVIASLYAMKSVMDTCKVNKRVRLILGINEESDWKCIKYYKEHEELPTIGFSPDADFPCIYAEKGVLSLYLQEEYSSYLNEPLIIEKIDCKKNAINVVPKECSVILKVNSKEINIESVINTLSSISNDYSIQADIKIIDNEKLQINSYGIASHAAHPEHGSNAITKLLILLYETFAKYNTNIGIIHLFNKYLTDYYGKDLEFDKLDDESGKLTINVGNISLDNNLIKIGLNIRIPVNTAISTIVKKFETISSPYPKIIVKSTDIKDALYIPKDNFLVTTLCDIFNNITGKNESPIAIGGATYARAFDNCISFGANFPGDKDMCHQSDEFIKIEKLILSSKIYAKAIYELAK